MSQYLETLNNISCNEWENHDEWSYADILNWVENTYGPKARLIMQLVHYDAQVRNGGHFQYFDNGYAEGNGGCFVKHTEQIPMHDWMVENFEKFGFHELPSGGKVLAVLKAFCITLDMDRYIMEEFENEETGECTEEEIENEDYMSPNNSEELNELDDVYYNLIDLKEWESVLEQQAKEVLENV